MSYMDQLDVEPDTTKGGEEVLLQGSSPLPPQKRLRRVCVGGSALALVGAMLGAALVLAHGRHNLVAGAAEDRSMAAIPGPQQSSSGMSDHLLGLQASSEMAAHYTGCFVDVNQAVFYLVQGANFITYATVDCKEVKEAPGRRACAAEISTVIASMGWTASYVAFAVNSCGVADSVPAGCAGAMATLVALLGEFSFISASITDACEIEGRRLQDLPKFDMNATGMPKGLTSPAPRGWLQEAKSFYGKYSEKLKEDAAKIRAAEEVSPVRGAQISQCVVDADVGATYVMRIGLQTYALATECPKGKACILDIFNVISSIAWVSQFFAQLPIDCPGATNAKAACAATVSDFVASVAALGPVVNGISDDCQPMVPAREYPLPVGTANWAS